MSDPKVWAAECIRCTFDRCAECTSGATHRDRDTQIVWQFRCTCTHPNGKGPR